MKSGHSLPLLGVVLVALIVFQVLFSLLQDEWFYYKTVGRYMVSCEVVGDSGEKDLANPPYEPFAEEKMLNWDAKHYFRISQEGYLAQTPAEKSLVPFFPLFPAIWKISHVPLSGVGWLNLLLFFLALCILGDALLRDEPVEKRVLLLATLFLLPSSIVFRMPYAEAASLLAGAIAVWAWFREKPILLLIGILAFSLSRPVFAMFLPALFLALLYGIFRDGLRKKAILQVGVVMLVFALGTFGYFAYLSLGHDSIWVFFDAQEKWETHFRMPGKITDWSFQGLAMSLYAFFGIWVPVSFCEIRGWFLDLKRNQTPEEGLLKAGEKLKQDWLFSFVLIYLTGLALFIIFFQGGNLHSYSRYFLSAPPGMILIILGIQKLQKSGWIKRLTILLIPLVPAIFLWSQLDYHWRTDFRDLGFIVMLFFAIFWSLEDLVPRWFRWLGFTGILGFAVLYQTSLWDYFLKDCWLFV